MQRQRYAPFFNALLCMIAFQGANIFSIIFIIGAYKDLKLSKDSALLIGLILFVLIIMVNYLFVYRDRLKIAEIREQYTEQEQRKSKRFFSYYIFSSLLLFVAAVICG